MIRPSPCNDISASVLCWNYNDFLLLCALDFLQVSNGATSTRMRTIRLSCDENNNALLIIIINGRQTTWKCIVIFVAWLRQMWHFETINCIIIHMNSKQWLLKCPNGIKWTSSYSWIHLAHFQFAHINRRFLAFSTRYICVVSLEQFTDRLIYI